MGGNKGVGSGNALKLNWVFVEGRALEGKFEPEPDEFVPRQNLPRCACIF
jgi:hypothetical protein